MIGRAGVGIDNVDVAAATRRGIVVANAPESTVVSAAEHTIGLLVALARNIPQAHAALKAGRWERSRWGGIELADKTLGVLGFGRIGQQVARRALGLGMRVVAYDPFVAPERFRELGVEHRRDAGGGLRGRRLPHAPPARSPTRREASSTRAPIERMRPGVRIVNAARGELVDEAGARRGASVRARSPALRSTSSRRSRTPAPLLELENVVVTPHLAASTEEAQDRAGVIVAEQVAAALEGGLVTNAVNIPVVGAEDLELLGPFIPLAARARPARDGARGRPGAPDRPVAPRLARGARHAPAHRGGAERRVPGTGRPAASTTSTRRSIAAERGIEVTRGAPPARRATTRTSSRVSVDERRGRRARRSGPSTATSSPARSASRSTSSSRRGWSSSATRTCPA